MCVSGEERIPSVIPRKQEARNDASSITTPTITTKPKTDRKKKHQKGKRAYIHPKIKHPGIPLFCPWDTRTPAAFLVQNPAFICRTETDGSDNASIHSAHQPQAKRHQHMERSAAQHSTRRATMVEKQAERRRSHHRHRHRRRRRLVRCALWIRSKSKKEANGLALFGAACDAPVRACRLVWVGLGCASVARAPPPYYVTMVMLGCLLSDKKKKKKKERGGGGKQKHQDHQAPSSSSSSSSSPSPRPHLCGVAPDLTAAADAATTTQERRGAGQRGGASSAAAAAAAAAAVANRMYTS